MKFVKCLILCLLATCIISCRGKGNTSSNKSRIEDKVYSDTIFYANKEIGNYSVKYSLHSNDVIADTIHVSDTESEIFYNRSLLLTVHYDDKLIVNDYEVRSTSFGGIDNPERFQLSPMGAVEINSVNDTLFVTTGMFVVDTDWGYFLTIKVSKNGDVILSAVDADDYYNDDSE